MKKLTNKLALVLFVLSLFGCDNNSYQSYVAHHPVIQQTPKEAKQACEIGYETHKRECWQPVYRLVEKRGEYGEDIVFRFGWPITSGPHKGMFLICGEE